MKTIRIFGRRLSQAKEKVPSSPSVTDNMRIAVLLENICKLFCGYCACLVGWRSYVQPDKHLSMLDSISRNLRLPRW